MNIISIRNWINQRAEEVHEYIRLRCSYIQSPNQKRLAVANRFVQAGLIDQLAAYTHVLLSLVDFQDFYAYFSGMRIWESARRGERFGSVLDSVYDGLPHNLRYRERRKAVDDAEELLARRLGLLAPATADQMMEGVKVYRSLTLELEEKQGYLLTYVAFLDMQALVQEMEMDGAAPEHQAAVDRWIHRLLPEVDLPEIKAGLEYESDFY